MGMNRIMTDQPKNCCGRPVDVFRDTKVGHTQEMWVVACANCGHYSDDLSRSGAIQLWNSNHRKRNPRKNESGPQRV